MNELRKVSFARRLAAGARTAIAAVATALLLVSCETMSQGDQGEVIGGVLGGVLGAQVGEGQGRTAAIIVGTLAGSLIGRQIGESMDDVDRMKTARVLNDSRTGAATQWINPDTGYEYTVTPTRTYDSSGTPCREFRLDATIGNDPDSEVYGTACRQADGSWLLQ